MDIEEQEFTARWAAHVRLARLLARAQRHAQARVHYETALRLHHEHSDNGGGAGKGRIARPSPIIAIPVAQVRLELAHVLVRLGDRDGAVATYRALLVADPGNVSAHVDLAAQLMIAGELGNALDHCERALALASTTREAQFNLNAILRRLGRQSEAIARTWSAIEATVGRRLRPNLSNDENPANADDKSTRGEPKASDCSLSTLNHRVVSVVCVKWGTKYGPEYVTRLHNALCRNEDEDRVTIDFVCLTDDPRGIDDDAKGIGERGLRCLALPSDTAWTGWWNKIALFAPAIASQLHRRCLYVDLDTVIVGDVTELIERTLEISSLGLLRTDAMANEQRAGGYNSSLIAWDNDGRHQRLHDVLREHFAVISGHIYKLDHWLEMMLPSVEFIDDLVPGQIVEFQSLRSDDQQTDVSMSRLPKDTRLVCFPLQPKPHQTTDVSWVAAHWR